MDISVKKWSSFVRWSHVISDLSKIAHFIQGQKCLIECFFEIRSLKGVSGKMHHLLNIMIFLEMPYLIESGFLRHMILCNAKCSYYEHKNHNFDIAF